MVQFADMEGLEIDANDAKPFSFQMAGEHVVKIWFKPAIEENTAYADGSLLLAQKNGRDANRKGKTNIRKEMQRARREDMALFSKYCAEKWEGVRDTNGGDVDFTKNNCFTFLTKIPTRYQDALRAWIRQSRNFLPEQVAQDDNEADDDDFDLDDLDEITSIEDLEDIIDKESAVDGDDDLGKPSGE